MPLFVLALALTGPTTGTLHVSGTAYGVEVVIDRRPVGRLPLDPQTVTVGLHAVELLRAGRVVWSQIVFVGPHRRVELVVELPPVEGPKPTLGDLKRAQPPRGPPTRYRLTGAVVAEAMANGEARDLDLAQWWRLDADGEVVSAAVQVSAVGDVAGAGPELGRVLHRPDDAPLLVEALWLRAADGPVSGRVGRLPQSGPLDRAFLLDGARVDARLGALDVRARAGRRETLLGPAPESPWMGGAAVAMGCDGWRFDVDALYHDGLHLDARGGAHTGRWRLDVSAAAIDTDPLRATVRGAVDLGGPTDGWLRDAWLEARWRGARRSPFELSTPLADLLALAVPAGRTVRGGLVFGGDPVRLQARGGYFDGHGAPRAERPDRLWLDADVEWRLGPWSLWARGGAMRADAGPPSTALALTARSHGAAGAGWRGGRLTLGASAGFEHLALAGLAGIRRLPTGAAELRVALNETLALVADVAAWAGHPALHSGDGPLLRGRLGLRLR